ncbi:MAG: AMP-binding protein, partial [Burkholderiaceae bacterium]|nr:AMP-binding protein [Burkholderiaceae bacterium]
MPASLASDWNIAPLNGLAQVKGRTDAALSNAPIHRFLLEAVQRFADRPAVVFREQGVRWTWAQLQAEVDALAAGFIALGLRVGDRVGIWSPNRAEWLVTQFATARAGLVLVNINPA